MLSMILYSLLVVVTFAVVVAGGLIWIVAKTDKLKDGTFEGTDEE